MKCILKMLILFALLLHAAPLRAQETEGSGQSDRRGECACNSTRDATVLSMMGWGLGIAVGIALLCGYLEQETAHSH
jgi:hypothetical protein